MDRHQHEALLCWIVMGSKIKYPFSHQLQFDSTFDFELGFHNLIKIHKSCLVCILVDWSFYLKLYTLSQLFVVSMFSSTLCILEPRHNPNFSLFLIPCGCVILFTFDKSWGTLINTFLDFLCVSILLRHKKVWKCIRRQTSFFIEWLWRWLDYWGWCFKITMQCFIVQCTRPYQKYCGNSKCGKIQT